MLFLALLVLARADSITLDTGAVVEGDLSRYQQGGNCEVVVTQGELMGVTLSVPCYRLQSFVRTHAPVAPPQASAPAQAYTPPVPAQPASPDSPSVYAQPPYPDARPSAPTYAPAPYSPAQPTAQAPQVPSVPAPIPPAPAPPPARAYAPVPDQPVPVQPPAQPPAQAYVPPPPEAVSPVADEIPEAPYPYPNAHPITTYTPGGQFGPTGYMPETGGMGPVAEPQNQATPTEVPVEGSASPQETRSVHF